MSAQAAYATVRRTYQFIKSHRQQFPVEFLCRVLGVAPSRLLRVVAEACL